MSEPARDPQVGTQFGPYLLRRLLARSDTGSVYEAVKTSTDRTDAVKVLSAELSADPQFRARLQREVHSAARLADPHVAPIHDFGDIGGRLFVAMRLIAGSDLRTRLERFGATTAAQAVTIVSHVASALDAAHSFGLAHRDVKPESILVTGNGFTYLTNFGIANLEDITSTGAGRLSDAYGYTAPERFAGESFDNRSDIYSLTCVFYECLTGLLPYPEKDLNQMIGAHLMQPVPRPSRSHSDVSSAFDEVIARGMAKSPIDRYATAGELGRAAENALAKST